MKIVSVIVKAGVPVCVAANYELAKQVVKDLRLSTSSRATVDRKATVYQVALIEK